MAFLRHSTRKRNNRDGFRFRRARSAIKRFASEYNRIRAVDRFAVDAWERELKKSRGIHFEKRTTISRFRNVSRPLRRSVRVLPDTSVRDDPVIVVRSR